MIPGVKVVRRGTRVYFPKKKIQELFEKGLKPMVEKAYPIHLERNEVQEVAGFTVGLRELNVNLQLHLDNYAMTLVETEGTGGKLIFIMECQPVNGEVKIHVEKALNVIVNMGDLINKDYTILFSFVLQRLVAEVEFKAGKDGIPEVTLDIKVEDLNLTRDLKYSVENGDMITGILDLLKGFWLPIVESEIKKNVLTKAGAEVTTIVNTAIQSNFKKVIDIEGPLNLQIDVTVHEVMIKKDFLILTIDGHFNNSKNPRDMDQVANPTFDMPKILDELSSDDIALQISDDNIYTLIYAFLQNRLDIEIDIDKSICNSITVFREPNYSAVVSLLKEKADNTEGQAGENINFILKFEIFTKITVDLKPLPDFDVRVKAASEICQFQILDEKRNEKEWYFKLSVANTEVLTLFDEQLNAIFKLSHNNAIYNKIREKMSKEKITQEVKAKIIKVGDRGLFAPSRIAVADSYLVVVGHLNFA